MVIEADGIAVSASPLRINVDGENGWVEVRFVSSALEVDALHVAFLLDRAVAAQWGELAAESAPACEAKLDALERMRATPLWGDAPAGASENELNTLVRLVATPLWDCAVRLATVLAEEAMCADGFQPRRIVELGAGLGVPGFLAARLWPEASVAVTDRGDSLLDLLRRNLCTNFPCSAPSGPKRARTGRSVLALDLAFGGKAAEDALAGPLGELGGPLELIIVSDCFFFPWYGDTWTPLRASMLELCGETTLVLLGVGHRNGGRVAEALEFVSQPPFHRRLLQQRDVECQLCSGEGYIDLELCWECEGASKREEIEEVWLLSKSEAALARWKSCSPV